jgi:hypothetical protein
VVYSGDSSEIVEGWRQKRVWRGVKIIVLVYLIEHLLHKQYSLWMEINNSLYFVIMLKPYEWMLQMLFEIQWKIFYRLLEKLQDKSGRHCSTIGKGLVWLHNWRTNKMVPLSPHFITGKCLGYTFVKFDCVFVGWVWRLQLQPCLLGMKKGVRWYRNCYIKILLDVNVPKSCVVCGITITT